MRNLLRLLPIVLFLASCGPEKPATAPQAKWQVDLRNVLAEAQTTNDLR